MSQNQGQNLKEIKLRIEAIKYCTKETSNLKEEFEEIEIERSKYLLVFETLPANKFKLGNLIYTVGQPSHGTMLSSKKNY